MIGVTLKRAVLIAAAAAACYGLAERFGVRTAVPFWAATAALACAVGTVLLRTGPLGRVTWRNRAAGYLIPGVWRLNKSLLWRIPFISWAVWMAVGGAAVLQRPGPVDALGVGVRLAQFAAWVADAAALVFVAGSIRQATPGGRVGSLWKLVAVIAGMLGVSVGLYLGGRPEAALVVGGGPPAVIGGLAGLAIALLMTFGRNMRWN